MTAKSKPKPMTLADVTYTDANGRTRKRYTVRHDGQMRRERLQGRVRACRLWDRKLGRWGDFGFPPRLYPTRAEAWEYLKTKNAEAYMLRKLNRALRMND